jgi:plasmid stabilization system protein ParE
MRTSYPKEKLVEAIAGARSWRVVNTRLGRMPEASTTNLKTLAEEYGIDVAHLAGQNRRTYTDAQLREAVQTSETWAEVAAKLGKNPRSGASRRVMRRAAELIHLDVSQLKSGRQVKAPGGEETAGVEPAVDESTPG